MKDIQTRLLTNEELKTLQIEERSILKEIQRICEKYAIPYYIVGGTLLGAVRHGGFIPWDDDIDIAMYRDDYDRFEEVCKTELGKEFFLQTYFTDKHYIQLMPKVRKNNTVLEIRETAGLKMHNGVFVDIFMLDYAKELDWRVRMKHKFHWMMINTFMRKQQHNIENPVKRFFADMIPGEMIVNLDNWIVSARKPQRLTVNYSSMYGFMKQTFPSEYYGEGIDLQFDDLIVKAPKEYKKMLEQIYGDYMKLPPIEKRGNHHRIHKFEVAGKE